MPTRWKTVVIVTIQRSRRRRVGECRGVRASTNQLPPQTRARLTRSREHASRRVPDEHVAPLNCGGAVAVLEDQRLLTAAGRPVAGEDAVGDCGGRAGPDGHCRTRVVADVGGDDPHSRAPAGIDRCVAAPAISRCESDISESTASTPVPSGVAASPTMRNPSIAASVTPRATTAAAPPGAVPGSRMTAPRGSLLTRRT